MAGCYSNCSSELVAGVLWEGQCLTAERCSSFRSVVALDVGYLQTLQPSAKGNKNKEKTLTRQHLCICFSMKT